MLVTTLTALAATLSVASPILSPASAATPVIKTPTGLPTAIEDLPRYVGQVACDTRQRWGTVALAKLLVRTYPDTSYNTTYSCGTDGDRSEHYDGRAIDWMASLRNPTQAAEARAAINWMLATDSAGHKFAMARRLGIQYIIWNGRIWGSYSQTWEPYLNCQTTAMKSTAHDSLCHRNHVHISLSWNGARGLTTFWLHRVFAFDYGPCAASDLNWGPDWSRPNYTHCLRHSTIAAPATASTVYKNLVKYSGAVMSLGDRGPIVSAVQAALRIPTSGTFDVGTAVALTNWQKAQKVVVTQTTNSIFWRRMLAHYRPR